MREKILVLEFKYSKTQMPFPPLASLGVDSSPAPQTVLAQVEGGTDMDLTLPGFELD